MRDQSEQSIRVVEHRPCPVCGAVPGQWCHNRYRATRVHAARARAQLRGAEHEHGVAR